MASHLYLGNKVQHLKSIIFSQLTYQEKCAIKRVGRPTPDLIIKQTSSARGKTYERNFNNDIYKRAECEWICGCEETNSLYCFPCLLFSKENTPWVKNGCKDLNHLSEKINKHKKSKDHINCAVSLSLLDKVNIVDHLDSAYKQSIARHNEQITKNRDALSKIINIIKFCGKHELPLRGHDEKNTSKNPGVFLGLVDYSCNLDSGLNSHIKHSTVFKGTSKTIQN